MNKDISISQLSSLSSEELQDIEILLVQLNPDFVPPAIKSSIQAVIDHPTTHILVAKSGNKIMGMITLCGYPKVEGNLLSWIEDFVVEESFRRKGVGTSLILAAHKLAKKIGFSSTVLTSRPSRVEANKYYKKVGYKKRNTNVYKHDL